MIRRDVAAEVARCVYGSAVLLAVPALLVWGLLGWAGAL